MASVVFGSPAWAQNAPIQATPLPPIQQQQWQQNPAPSLPQTGSVPQAPQASPSGIAGQTQPGPGQNVPGPGAQGPDQPSSAAPQAAPPAMAERPNIWVPAGAAKLEALDKVNAQASELTIKVGQSATFGSLTISVKSCMVRPPDQPADAAAYLDVTDSHPDAPAFDGWLLENEPSVSMMQHPIYDLRVAGCA
jgi:hypothetical protein